MEKFVEKWVKTLAAFIVIFFAIFCAVAFVSARNFFYKNKKPFWKKEDIKNE